LIPAVLALAACASPRQIETVQVADPVPGVAYASMDPAAFMQDKDADDAGETVTTAAAPVDSQVVVEEIPPLTGATPETVTGPFAFKLAKGSRQISYEDEWMNLQTERKNLPLLELAGTNPWILMKRVMSIGVTEVRPLASGGEGEFDKSFIKQSAEDLVTSYQIMSGAGITTKWEAPMSFKRNTFTFQVDDVLATEKLPHSHLQDLAFHIVYMKEGSPYAPYWIFHGPIDDFRSLVSKLQGRKILTLGWDIVEVQ